MEVIILAGGKGTRLRGISGGTPKAMMPIHGEPFLELLVRDLKLRGCSRFVFSLGYKAEVVIAHFEELCNDLQIDFVVEKKQLGTGGGLMLAMEKIKLERFIVCNGDTFLEFDSTEVTENFHNNETPVILGTEVNDTGRFGELQIKGNRIIGFQKGRWKKSGIINTGVCILSKADFKSYDKESAFSLEEDFWPRCVEKSVVNILKTSGQFIDIGTPEDYRLAESILKQG